MPIKSGSVAAMSLSLNAENYENKVAEPLALEPPARKKSPAIAFFLSLLLPGAGHMYMDKVGQGFALVFLCILSVPLLLSGIPALVGEGIFLGPAIYIFAALDAFAIAREYNAGFGGRLTGNSPRVACVLNLLTKGFGYFYLGDRAKGIGVIIGLFVLQGLLAVFKTPYLSVFATAIQIFLAADAYRVGRKRLLEANPEIAGDVIKEANAGGLAPAGVWLILGVVLLFCIGATVLVVIVATGGKMLTAKDLPDGSYENSSAGLTYTNPALGLKMTAPEGWTPYETSNTIAGMQHGSCSVLVMARKKGLMDGIWLDNLAGEMSRRHPDIATTRDFKPQGGFANDAAMRSVWKTESGTKVEQRFIYDARGKYGLTLVETHPSDDFQCFDPFLKIENSTTVQ